MVWLKEAKPAKPWDSQREGTESSQCVSDHQTQGPQSPCTGSDFTLCMGVQAGQHMTIFCTFSP